MFYVVAGAIVLRWTGVKNPSVWSFGLTCAVEFLQAWQAPWLMSLRNTVPGRLVLGTHFSWLDFPPYAAGGLVSWLLLRSLRINRRP